MIALKLAGEQDLKISPEAFLNKLASSLASLDTLTKDLCCTPEDLADTLLDSKTLDLIKLKAHLATLQVKLLAIQYLPHAFVKLVKLMNESEKPEVARRSANTVIHLAGIPTNTKAQPPTITVDQQDELDQTQAEEEPPPHMDDEKAKKLVAAMDLGLKFQETFTDVSSIPLALHDEIGDLIANFIAANQPRIDELKREELRRNRR